MDRYFLSAIFFLTCQQTFSIFKWTALLFFQDSPRIVNTLLQQALTTQEN